jgi:hypothetical protein
LPRTTTCCRIASSAPRRTTPTPPAPAKVSTHSSAWPRSV